MPCRHIIHTVGPIVKDHISKLPRKDLENCYLNSLKIVEENEDIRTLALCSISTGIYGYPIEQATCVALKIVRAWMKKHYKQV